MISIADMQNIAAAEKKAEKKAKEAKFQKDLAAYRDKVKKVQPKIVEYIQQQIISAMKNNQSKAGLYIYDIEKIFDGIIRYPKDAAIFYCFLYNPDRKCYDALETVFKEMALKIRKELFEAGVKKIQEGSSCAGEPRAILLLKNKNTVKTAINKCPVCGGDINIQADINVRISCCGHDAFLSTETSDILWQLDNIIAEYPDEYECYCDDCENHNLIAKPIGHGNYEISAEVE